MCLSGVVMEPPGLNESPSEKEGKCVLLHPVDCLSLRPQ